MNNKDFVIDFHQPFENLPNAPIVEAVIHWRAKAGRKLEPDDFLGKLKDRLPNYPNSQRQQEVKLDSEISTSGSSFKIQQPHWHGFRFESKDKRHVAQFTSDGLAFSRLKPYQDWEQFESEAQRLWQIYVSLAGPPEIQRLGVRFINLVTPASPETLKEILVCPPCSPNEMPLPIKEFMHRSTFSIPNHPYNLNVIQTIAPPKSERESASVILDLDVFTTRAVENNQQQLKRRLQEMRWIKNKAFFTFVHTDAIAKFKGKPL